MANKKDTIQTFEWSGTDRRGVKKNGELAASSIAEARRVLKKQGINATKIKKKAQPLFGGKGGKIGAADIAVFTRQMATMAKAGVPLVQSLEIVAEGTENQKMQQMVLKVRDNVASGTSFSDALAENKDLFDDLFISLIASGEQSGALETMLDRVAVYQEKSIALKGKIKKAMGYPIAVMVVAMIVTAVLLIFVVPTFAATFESFGSELPAFTQKVVDLSDFLQKWWLAIIVGMIFSVHGFKLLLKTSTAARNQADRLILKLPIFGMITEKSIVARFSRTLSTTFAAGVPLVDALDSVRGATGNIVYKNATKQIRDDVMSGQQLNFAIRNTSLFPLLLLQMVAIGEEAGSLDEMLDKVASIYEQEVDDMVDGLMSMMEPLIMAVLGVLVGGILVAMYLPMFKIGQALG